MTPGGSGSSSRSVGGTEPDTSWRHEQAELNDGNDEQHEGPAGLDKRPFTVPAEGKVVTEQRVWATRSGEELNVADIAKARIKELEHMRDHRVFEVVKLTDVRNVKKVKAKWLQDRKGDGIKSRLVAMEIAYDVRDDVHAGTPPLAAIRLIISLAASRAGVMGEMPRKIGLFDITAAFIHAFIKACMVIIPPRASWSR